MANKYLNDTGLQYFFNKLKTIFQMKESGKGLSTNDYTTEEKSKLSGIEASADVNQNAFSYVKIGNDIISADTVTDTLELEAGSYLSLTADTTNDKITVNVSGVVADDHKWNDVQLYKSTAIGASLTSPVYIPTVTSTSDTSSYFYTATSTPSNITRYSIPLYDSGVLKSLTPSSGDSSTKVATTEFVNTAITNALAGIDQKVSVITGTLGSSSGVTSVISYPTGYTFNNCFVSGWAVADLNKTTLRTGIGTFNSSFTRQYVIMSADGIQFYNNDSSLYGHEFRVYLMRFD